MILIARTEKEGDPINRADFRQHLEITGKLSDFCEDNFFRNNRFALFVNVTLVTDLLTELHLAKITREPWFKGMPGVEKVTLTTQWQNLMARQLTLLDVSRARNAFFEQAAAEIVGNANQILVQRCMTHDAVPRNCGAVKAFAQLVNDASFRRHEALYAKSQRLILDEINSRDTMLKQSTIFAATVIANNQDCTAPDDYTINRAREALAECAEIRQHALDYLAAHKQLDPGVGYAKRILETA